LGITRPPALILGLGANGYGILRSLARERICVAGFFTKPEEFGRLSKYCETHYLPPSLDDEEICQALIDCGRRQGDKPVLFPTSDDQTLFLARHRAELCQHFRFHWADAESLSRVVDKARMSRICGQAGVLIPRTHVTAPDENLDQAAAGLSFPCLIKPNRSFDSPFPPKLKNFVATSRGEYLAFYRAHPDLKGTTVCQEIIEGGDENVFQCTALVRASGEPGAVFCARKLHQYPPGYGVMCFGRSEENEAPTAQAVRLLDWLQYRGLASLEFKYRVEDGRYYFIEMNPRLPWYNALFFDAGVNLPYLTYLDLTGDRRSEPMEVRQRNGVYWISFKLDAGWFARTWSKGRVRLLAWLRSLARARSYAWFDWRDPKPFLRATADFLSTGIRESFKSPPKNSA
jgi:predicted ATP-grasp superfamily ATP-dependent carboligase